ncbi:LOW QUALITY PROTEIN: glucosidase 2 subunit beta [Ascaphus truei]|uniref:LOW QUALITY PROTEIN: glucosidase 2 subunit beta n=1 Tax=Ascaphus truei TaxID=8439 RepID=UPI003F59816C
MEILLVLLASLGCFAVEVKRPRGVSLTNRHFYDETRPFTCLDGSKTIPFDRVNDDYCDCADGTDEPGTAACSNGKFHCSNAGYRPQYMPASRVNDGVCDCCDTTDEYNSGAFCQNTCREMGRRAREELQQMAEVTREGLLVKQQLIEEARKGREEKQGKLQDVEQRRQALQTQVEALRTEKEAAEIPEREAKETQKKEWEERRAAESAESDKRRAAEAFAELDQDADRIISASELLSRPELDTDGDGTLSAEEAQSLLGDLDSVDLSRFLDSVWPQIREKFKSEAEPPPPRVDEGTEPHPEMPTEEEEEEEGEEEGEEEDEESEEDHTAPPTKPQGEEPEGPVYDEATQALIDTAQKARSQYEEAEKSLRDMEETIRCVITRLLSALLSLNRSTQVKLSCGKETLVTSTSEPSRCEYLMEFFTPAACRQPQDVLPGDHDEL